MARRDRMAAMAAVLSRTGAGQAERLLELFQGDVAPRLAALERCRRQHRLGYVVALTGMLGGIFALFLLVQNLRDAIFAGALVLAIGFLACNGRSSATPTGCAGR
jgi:hypothetical protein